MGNVLLSIIKQNDDSNLKKEAIGMPKKHPHQENPKYVIDALARAFLQLIERDYHTSKTTSETETETKAS